MLRATSGIWVNYGTTVLFQVLFAVRFGSGSQAELFVVTFSVLLAVGALAAVTVQSVVVPRLLTANGELQSAAIRLVLVLTGVSAVVFLTVFIFPSPFAHLFAGVVHEPAATT